MISFLKQIAKIDIIYHIMKFLSTFYARIILFELIITIGIH